MCIYRTVQDMVHMASARSSRSVSYPSRRGRDSTSVSFVNFAADVNDALLGLLFAERRRLGAFDVERKSLPRGLMSAIICLGR